MEARIKTLEQSWHDGESRQLKAAQLDDLTLRVGQIEQQLQRQPQDCCKATACRRAGEADDHHAGISSELAARCAENLSEICKLRDTYEELEKKLVRLQGGKSGTPDPRPPGQSGQHIGQAAAKNDLENGH